MILERNNININRDNKNLIMTSNGKQKNEKIFNVEGDNLINQTKNINNKYSNLTKKYYIRKSLDIKKINRDSFSDGVELSFEKNNTLLISPNFLPNNEAIYKKILSNNNKKKESTRPIRIIKCEKINIQNKGDQIFQTSTKNNLYKFGTKLNNIKRKKFLHKNELINKGNNYSFDNKNEINLSRSLVLKRARNKEMPLDKLALKIKKKGYIDSNDFMKAIKEENKKKENIIKIKLKKKENENKIILDKTIIELLKRINTKKKKIKINNKENLEIYKTFRKNNFNKNNLFINSDRIKESNNIKFNGDVIYNKEIEELKNNLNIKNFNNIKTLNNFNLTDKKNIRKSLKVMQLEKEKNKILKYNMKEGQKENEIARILEKPLTERNEEINNLFKNKNCLKETPNKKSSNDNKKNVIINKNNSHRDNKILTHNNNTYQNYSNDINDVKINKINNSIKKSHNLVIKSKKIDVSTCKNEGTSNTTAILTSVQPAVSTFKNDD